MFQITKNDITQLTKKIVEQFQPERIILFGSQAYGTPHEDSDIDLLIIMQFEGRAFRKALEVLAVIDFRKPIDLIIKTPKEVEERYQLGDPLIAEALDRGQVLYERPAC